jgi:hypothetical protein
LILDTDSQTKLWHQMNFDIHRIGVIVGYSAIANQLVQYIEDLNAYSSVDCFGIIIDDEMNNHKEWLEKHYPDVPFLCFLTDECEKIALFDAVIIPESNQQIYQNIPSTTIKIGLPHGTDVSIESTLCGYGGGFAFDYILGAKKQPKLAVHKYINSFPALMRLHKHSFVSEIPFGFPKLDKFFNVVSKQTQPKKSIIYHISLLSVEEPWVVDNLFDTLKTLLDEFPKYKIVFRVHDFNREHPNVIKCINLGQKYQNFHYSDADSYIDDYAIGALMITHREYYNHLFDLATGCPTVVYKLDPEYALRYEHDERYFKTDKEHFIAVLNHALNNQFDISIEIRRQRCLSAGIFNPGSSVDYLVDNLANIIRGHVLPEWTTYYLNEGTSKGIDFKLRQLIASNRQFGTFAMFYAAMTKYSALSLLLLAESFIRNTTIKEYYYPLAFAAFYQLVQHEDFRGISAHSRYWWDVRGKFAFEFCFDAIQKGEINLTPQLKWLSEHYQVSAETADDLTDVVCGEVKIFSFYDGSDVKCEDVIFYGAGAFTGLMLLSNEDKSKFNPVAIFDNDEVKQNTLFMGIPVLSPAELKNYPQNIILGSQGSVIEIVNSLIVNIGVKNQLYGFVSDPINHLLLKLLNKN